MYLIAKRQGGYQAIPIKTGDKWHFRILLVGRREVRIILRVRGRQQRWRDQGLISPTTPELYHGHAIDPKTDQLVSHFRVDLDDIVVMDHEPPVDCVQEELPY